MSFFINILGNTLRNDNAYDGKFPDFSKPKGKRVNVSETIVVRRGETFDGKNRFYDAVDSKLGDGSQKENQKPLFKIEKSGKIKNVFYAGADGIHVDIDTELRNVSCLDTGEDALTVLGNPDSEYGIVKWIGGGARKATDKIVQLNRPCMFIGKDLQFEDFGRAVRGNGNSKYRNTRFDVELSNIKAKNGDSIVKLTSKKGRANIDNILTINVDKIKDLSNGSIAKITNSKTYEYFA